MEGMDDEDDENEDLFLKKIESNLLKEMSLRGMLLICTHMDMCLL